MATPDELREYSEEPLDDLERELVREALSIDGRAGEAIYDDSELRMEALTAVQNQLIRKYLDVDLPAVDEDRDIKVAGGSAGKYYTPLDREDWVRRAIRRMLYPDSYNNPTESNNQPHGLIRQIPVTYASGSQEFD